MLKQIFYLRLVKYSTILKKNNLQGGNTFKLCSTLVNAVIGCLDRGSLSAAILKSKNKGNTIGRLIN